MVPYVPPEIVLHVLSFVPGPAKKETLLSCALVCREWRPLAQSTLLKRISFLIEPELGQSQVVEGLIEAAGRETGGWRCDEFDTAELNLSQLVNILESATAVKHISLGLQCFAEEKEGMLLSVDWLAFDCLNELDNLDLVFAPIGPTQAKLVNLRDLTFNYDCEAGHALPSIIAAAPNLKRLAIQLDSGTSKALAKCSSSVLTGLQHLSLSVMNDSPLELAQFEVVLKFVADCSAHLRSVRLKFSEPFRNSAVLRAISSHLDKIDMWIAMEDADEFSLVGAELSKMALMKATQHVKEWSVGLWIKPPADEQWLSRLGPLVEGAWEDDDWLEWVAMCDERGAQLQVMNAVDEYNAEYFP